MRAFAGKEERPSAANEEEAERRGDSVEFDTNAKGLRVWIAVHGCSEERLLRVDGLERGHSRCADRREIGRNYRAEP